MTRTASGRYKRYWKVQYFNIQYSVPFPTWIQDLSETFKMFDINATRLPYIFSEFTFIPFVGDVTQTLILGERWAQHPFNDVPIVLICCVLAFVEYPVVRSSYVTKVLPSHFLMLIQGNSTELDCYWTDFKSYGWTYMTTSKVRPLLVSSWVRATR